MITDLANEKIGSEVESASRTQMAEGSQRYERPYINLFQNNFLVQLVVDILTGEIIDANEAATRFYGHSIDEIKNMKVWDINPTGEQFILEKLHESYERGSFYIISKHRRYDNELRDVEIFNNRSLIGNRKVVHVIIHDITDRIKAEKALQDSNDRIQKVIKNEVVGVMFWDTTTGTLIDANETFLNLLGYSYDDVMAHDLTWKKLTPQEYYDLSLEEMEKYSVTGHIGPYEKEYFCKDGTRKWLLFAGSALEGHIAVEFCVDLTDKKYAQSEALRQAQRAESLLRISTNLNADLEIYNVYQNICAEACKILPAQVSLYFDYDESSKTYQLMSTSEGLENLSSISMIDSKWMESLIEMKGNVCVCTEKSALKNLTINKSFQGFDVQSIAYSVIKRDEIKLGLLIAINIELQKFNKDNIALLEGLTNYASSALTNARLFKETNDQLNKLSALRTIDLAIMDSLDLQSVFNVILSEVVKTLNVDAAAILHMNDVSKTLIYEGAIGFSDFSFLKTEVQLGHGYSGVTALENKVIFIHDLNDSANEIKNVALNPTFMSSEGFVSYYSVPLVVKNRVLGVLEVFHRSLNNVNNQWLSFLETIAGQAAIAVDNAELLLKLESSNMNLLKAYDATIEGWAYALDLKDGETENHSRRVTDLTLYIAEKIGVPSDKLIALRRGALLHDIGKMGIPDSILLKPGKLTGDEWQIMKMHPTYAHDMLSKIEYLKEALDIPFCHHEKWDGSGYPQGLKGKQIPLAARIFAIVDVYDALTSNRPYRKAWSREKTIEYILEQAEHHFDPEIVEVFVKEINKTKD